MCIWVVELYDSDCEYPFHRVNFFFKKSAKKFLNRNEKWFDDHNIRVSFGGEHLFFKSWGDKE